MFLQIKGLTKQFGGLIGVSHFDMSVDKGKIVGLIGPNGKWDRVYSTPILSVVKKLMLTKKLEGRQYREGSLLRSRPSQIRSRKNK